MATAKAKTASKATTVLEFDTDKIKAREQEVARETDEQIYERLAERFDILHEMTVAVKKGDVRAMIVSGPPGVGKSFGVEAVLSKDDLFDTLLEVIAVQHALFIHNLLDTQDLLTISIHLQIDVVATAFQCIQVITQAFRLYVLELNISNEDRGTLELKAIWNAF